MVCGIGVYEKGKHLATLNRKASKEYSLWMRMLVRCQPGSIEQIRRPSYIGCSVHPDFIHFQDFAEWCQTQIGFGNTGWHLEKDILIQGNKIYGPDTCVFVPLSLNSLLTHNKINKGVYPTGVSWHKKTSKYTAQIHLQDTVKYLGVFDSPDAALVVYRHAKLAEIHRQAEFYKESIDIRAYHALMNYKF